MLFYISNFTYVRGREGVLCIGPEGVCILPASMERLARLLEPHQSASIDEQRLRDDLNAPVPTARPAPTSPQSPSTLPCNC